MKFARYVSIILLFALAGCVTINPFDPDKTEPSEAKLYPLETTTNNSADEVKAEGEGLPKEAVKPAEKTEPGPIAERLLATGVLEVGASEASVTLLQFTEYHCFYCSEFAQQYTPNLLKDYIEPGKVKLQIQILPLKKYAGSNLGASALICAGEQGKGWPMHKALFGSQVSLQRSKQLAEDLKLNIDQFNGCLASDQLKQYLAEQTAIAQSLDVTLVPTFFFNGAKQVGLPLYPDLQGRIDKMLEE